MKLGRYIVGLISGLTFGMLFAPKKGKMLRDDILKRSEESGADALAVLGRAMKEAGEEAWQEVKGLSEHEQVEAVLAMSKEKIQEFLASIEDSGYETAGKAQEKLEELAMMATKEAKRFKAKSEKKVKQVEKHLKKKAGPLPTAKPEVSKRAKGSLKRKT